MKLGRKSYIVNKNDTVIYDRNGNINKKYLSRYNRVDDTCKIIKTYKCPGCTQNSGCRFRQGRTPFVIIDKQLRFESRCYRLNHMHHLNIKHRQYNCATIQEAIKIMYDNLHNLTDLSLETTLLITSMYNFFESQGEYNANSKM